MIEDEIALCDKKIQRIVDGGEGDWELKIESNIEGCNDIWVRNQGRMYQHLEDQCLPPFIKRKRLTEAVLITQGPCQARYSFPSPIMNSTLELEKADRTFGLAS